MNYFLHTQVLYFGDSLRSDIIPSKVYAGWDTVLVLEEMASERCFHAHRPDNLVVEVLTVCLSVDVSCVDTDGIDIFCFY